MKKRLTVKGGIAIAIAAELVMSAIAAIGTEGNFFLIWGILFGISVGLYMAFFVLVMIGILVCDLISAFVESRKRKRMKH